MIHNIFIIDVSLICPIQSYAIFIYITTLKKRSVFFKKSHKNKMNDRNNQAHNFFFSHPWIVFCLCLLAVTHLKMLQKKKSNKNKQKGKKKFI